jgi:deazaflavin-dependent oxidoreductase (nitroreductase family)
MQAARKRRISSFISVKLLNPFVKAAARAGLPTPGVAILETTGRKSGQPRRTPVGRHLDGDTFWIVAEHGEHAAYLRNIRAEPRVRVKLGRHWRTGTAHPLPEDDWRERQHRMPGLNAAVVRAAGSEPMTVRIDLDPLRPPASAA